MTQEEAIDSIYLLFTTDWDAASTGVTLSYDETPNLKDRPDDNATTKNPDPIVVVSCDILRTSQATLGAKPNRRFRRNGIMIIKIMTARNQGRLLEDQFAKIVFDSLEGECTPEGVVFDNLTPLAGFNAGTYRVKQINVDFEYDEIK